jgi:ATP-dependent DNA ligase
MRFFVSSFLKDSFKKHKEKKVSKAQILADFYKERKMTEITPEEFESEVFDPDLKFCILTKWDGLTHCLEYDRDRPKGKRCRLVSRHGWVYEDLPVLEEAEEILNKEKWKTAHFMGETIAVDKKGKMLSFNLVQSIVKAPRDKEEEKMVNFRVYDLVQLDGKWYMDPYDPIDVSKWGILPKEKEFPDFDEREEIWKRVFGEGKRIQITPSVYTRKLADFKREWKKWVEKEKFEGLVVRFGVEKYDEDAVKVKPYKTYDLCVVGALEQRDKYGKRKNQLGSVLTAFVTLEKGKRIFVLNSFVGSGFTDEERKEFWEWAKKNKVDGPKLKKPVDIWVKPERVVEIQWMGNPIMETDSVSYSTKEKSYKLEEERLVPKMRIPRFIRWRPDKKVNARDCGFRQVADWIRLKDAYLYLKKIRPELAEEE